jgi:hypothetical protein
MDIWDDIIGTEWQQAIIEQAERHNTKEGDDKK